MIRQYFTIGLVLAIMGCKTIQSDASAPALLEEISDETFKEIHQVITTALNGRKVTIAGNVFTKSSKLIIQRKKHMDAGSSPVQTRVDEAPIIYQLLKQNDSCFIEEVSSNKRYRLVQTKCRVISD